MGDMADYTLEQIEDFEDNRVAFRCGRMTYLEAYDLGIIDELGTEIGTETSTVTCKNCKKSGLIWRQHQSGKWWLIDIDGQWHNCQNDKE